MADNIKVLDEIVLEAKNIDRVKFLKVLPNCEKTMFAVNIKYCIRIIHLEEGKKYSIDYGSYSRFILVEEIE